MKNLQLVFVTNAALHYLILKCMIEEQKNSPKMPMEIHLEAGKTYLWCQCGLSKNQPFCDNSHVGTSIKPKVFSVYTSRKMWLCICKKTKNVPYCDGSHLK